jgi:hypothetical protein
MSFSKTLHHLAVFIISLSVMYNMANAGSIVEDSGDYCLTDFTALARGSVVRLKWADSGAPQYNLYRSDDDGVSYQLIAQITSSITAYQDSGLILGTSYQYRVKEVNQDGIEVCQSPVLYITPKERSGNKAPVFVSTPVLLGEVGIAK